MPYPIGTIVGWDGRHSSDGTEPQVPHWAMHGGQLPIIVAAIPGYMVGHLTIGRDARMTRLTDATSVGRPGRDHVVLFTTNVRTCRASAHVRDTRPLAGDGLALTHTGNPNFCPRPPRTYGIRPHPESLATHRAEPQPRRNTPRAVAQFVTPRSHAVHTIRHAGHQDTAAQFSSRVSGDAPDEQPAPH